MAVSWSQALAWRMRRHLLDPVGSLSVADVVRRLGAVPAQPGRSAELAVRMRRTGSEPGEVARALAAGHLITTYAFRGATHLLTPEEGGAYLALRAAGRMWERSSWQAYYELKPSDWTGLREAVRESLAGGPLTREELARAVAARPRFRHLRRAMEGGGDTILKPLAWQGDMSFGAPRDGRATFQSLGDNPRWRSWPDLDEAGVHAVEAYLRAYGPATPVHLHYWLGEGLGAGRRRIQSWIASMGDRIVDVDVEGERAVILHDDRDELCATRADSAVRFLPGYDQWVLGPGTADPHVVPPARRALVSHGANLVVVGGVVSGTWSWAEGELVATWFGEGGAAPERALVEEGSRLAAVLDRPLRMTVLVG